ncbi:hypothetical protein V7103_22070 [Neobacillus drentensis]|jgi:hypothetical protein|uniref:hypothetical protein n=1 Tax=Neobacillus drentensis TaxID=220684 RepID=UPI002FFDE98C
MKNLISELKKMGIPVEVMEVKPKGELIEGERLKEILNETITPFLSPLGLQWRGDYHWVGESNNSIRKVFSYDLCKGGQGTFSWGICTDFIPLPSGSRLVNSRTFKSAKLQLFERAECTTSHWEDDDIKGTIIKTLQDEIKKIECWFNRVNTIEDIRKIAYEQLKDDKYCMHHPNQNYILAFIEAKLGNIDIGLELIEKCDSLSFNKKESIKQLVIKKIKDN